MNNSKPRILPSELTLALAAVELGLADLALVDQLNCLWQYQKDYALVLKLRGRHKFPAQLVSDGVDAVPTDDDSFALLSAGGTTWFSTEEYCIELGSFRFRDTEGASVSSIAVDGKGYYLLDESQTQLESVCNPPKK